MENLGEKKFGLPELAKSHMQALAKTSVIWLLKAILSFMILMIHKPLGSILMPFHKDEGG